MEKTYSITLSNGITISCSDAYKLRDYLYDMHSAFFELWQYYYRVNMDHQDKWDNLEKITDSERSDISDAIDRINESCEDELS